MWKDSDLESTSYSNESCQTAQNSRENVRKRMQTKNEKAPVQGNQTCVQLKYMNGFARDQKQEEFEAKINE